MKVSPYPSRRFRAFTLIELLVVITIIAVLAGLVFTAGPAIMRDAKKKSTSADIQSLVVAINEYYTDHKRYPVTPGQKDDMFIGGEDGESTEGMMSILLAEPTSWNSGDKLNKEKKVYFKPRIAKGSSSRPTGGLGEDGRYYDRFGNEYRILIDANYDGVIDHSAVDEFDYEDRPALQDGAFRQRGGVLIQSYGEDGEHGKKGNMRFRPSDDAVSWM